MACEEVHFAGHRGDEIRGWSFTGADPQNEAGVVLIHEVFGLDAFVQGVGERLAQVGYTVLAPDLYSRDGLPGPTGRPTEPAPVWTAEEIRAAVASLPDRRVLGDIEGALTQLGARSKGVMGFCMGGNYAFLAGCTSRRVSAVVDFYGRIVYAGLSANKPTQPLEMALNLEAPLLGLFGEADDSIPPEHVRAMQDRLSQFAKSCEIVTYPGAAHGFFNSLRKNHDKEASQDAWRRTLAFLEENLTA